MKKLFLAISAQNGMEDTATQIIKKLRAGADRRELDIRWVPLQNFHVTVIFLGPTDETKIPEIRRLMNEATATTAPFNLKITNVGAFPDEISSRVLWFGVQNSRALRSFQDKLSEIFRRQGYPLGQRDFFPHLTIGRLRSPHRTKDLISPFVRKKIARIEVHELVLYESVGSFPFPTYKILEKSSLTGSPEVEEISENSFLADD